MKFALIILILIQPFDLCSNLRLEARAVTPVMTKAVVVAGEEILVPMTVATLTAAASYGLMSSAESKKYISNLKNSGQIVSDEEEKYALYLHFARNGAIDQVRGAPLPQNQKSFLLFIAEKEIDKKQTHFPTTKRPDDDLKPLTPPAVPVGWRGTGEDVSYPVNLGGDRNGCIILPSTPGLLKFLNSELLRMIDDEARKLVQSAKLEDNLFDDDDISARTEKYQQLYRSKKGLIALGMFKSDNIFNNKVTKFADKIDKKEDHPVFTHTDFKWAEYVPYDAPDVFHPSTFEIALNTAIQRLPEQKVILFMLDDINLDRLVKHAQTEPYLRINATNEELCIILSNPKFYAATRWFSNNKELTEEQLKSYKDIFETIKSNFKPKRTLLRSSEK